MRLTEAFAKRTYSHVSVEETVAGQALMSIEQALDTSRDIIRDMIKERGRQSTLEWAEQMDAATEWCNRYVPPRWQVPPQFVKIFYSVT